RSLHVAAAVLAIVSAVSSERSLWASNSAPAGVASDAARPSVTADTARRTANADMRDPPEGVRRIVAAGCRGRISRRSRACPAITDLLQLVLHPGESCPHAGLVNAGRARESDARNHIVADLHRHAARNADHARQRRLLTAHRIVFHRLGEV